MPEAKRYTRLRLILGDQLNASHSWFRECDDHTLYLIAELAQETTYVRHHVQKICAFFAAMAHFAEALKQAGHQVLHLTLDDTRDDKSLPALLDRLIRRYGIEHVEYQRPDEYRLLVQLQDLALPEQVTVHECDTEHFLLDFSELVKATPPQRHTRMESFYRKLRKRFDILMQDGEPEGGQWNFDKDNRKPLKPDDLDAIPAPLTFSNGVSTILDRLQRHKVDTFGTATATLLWPVTRKQALALLHYFCDHLLPRFGHFQDAMTARSPHAWSLYHSRLSYAMNAKILSPLQVIETAIKAYRARPDEIDIAQIEGFVRQILGWREYVRSVYWANMPRYQDLNALEAERDLPEFYWTGDTRMHCMAQAIGQSLEHAYAHHIQRLMITGNFATLFGMHPDQVDAWYLGIYIDAIEWVEMPNTRGMSQFADGGLIATKPYVSGGNYINKMSDYCKDCHYDIRDNNGDKACPFNSLYWHFMDRHRQRFDNNPRIGMIYRTWDKKSDEDRQATLARAGWCLKNLDSL